MQWQYGDLRLREALLLKGDVDAILGFDSTMYFNLVRQGIPPADIKFLYFSDVRLNIYGNGILPRRRFMEIEPEGRRAASLPRPPRAGAMRSRIPPLPWQRSRSAQASRMRSSETAKLERLIKNRLVTDESKADGLGGVRADRLAPRSQPYRRHSVCRRS